MVARPAATVTRRTRTTGVTATVVLDESDKLAKDLNRVLKVSDPVPQVKSTIRRAAPSAKAGPSTAPATAAARKASTTTVAATRPTARTTARPNAAAASAKRDTELVKHDLTGTASLPWMSAEMKTAERAKGAMGAINIGIKSLSTAVHAGYRVNTPNGETKPKTPAAVAGKGKAREEFKQSEGEEWNAKKVEEIVETCEIALKVLREMDLEGKLGEKGIDVERASMALVGKSLAMRMYSRALAQLVMARPALIQRYRPDIKTSDHIPSWTPTPLTADQARAKSRTTISKPASSIARRETPTAQTAVKPTMDPAWKDLTWMPVPTANTVLDETLRGLLCQAMLSAWVALAGALETSLDATTLYPVSTHPSSSNDHIHPLELSLSLPAATSTSLLHMLYRVLVATSPKDRPQWLHSRHIALLSLSLTITALVPPSKTTPAQFWEHSHATLAAFTEANKADEQILSQVQEVVSDLVQWVEKMVELREEARDAWFRSKEWNAFADFWIGVARRVRHVDAIERALSFMTASSAASTTPSTPPPPSSSSASTPSAPVKKQPKAKDKASTELEADLTRWNGDLAKANLVLDKYISDTSDINAAAAESALRTSNLESLSDALSSLDNGEAAKAGLAKVSRSVERIRRTCAKILGLATAKSSLALSAQHWLVSAVDLAEDTLQSPLDITDIVLNIVAGSIDTLLMLCKTPTSSSLADLDRGYRLCTLSRQSAETSNRADWLRCLSGCAYNTATVYWQQGKTKECLNLAKRSTDWAKESLSLVDDKDRSQSPWKGVQESLGRKYELMAVCSHKLSDRTGACDAYFGAMAHAPTSVISTLTSDLALKSLDTAFEPHTDLINYISRLSQIIVFDPTAIVGRANECTAILDILDPATKGAMLERLIGVVSEGLMKSELAEVMLEIGNEVVKVYTEGSMPVRRLRIITKKMAIISQTGVGAERFDGLVEQVEQYKTSGGDLAHDTNLSFMRSELVNVTLLLRALQAYHTPEARLSVYDLAKEAMTELRSLLLPATRSNEDDLAKAKGTPSRGGTVKGPLRTARTATKTPARSVSDSRTVKAGTSKIVAIPKAGAIPKAQPRISEAPSPVFGDLLQLTKLLGSLSALLGMLGHVLARVESLKLLRSLLRNNDVLGDDYVSKSSLLAIEYLKLGKHSRAKFVFKQTARYVETAKKDVSLNTRVELHLRHAIFLAMAGDVDPAEEEYSTAHALDQQIVLESNAGFLAKIVYRRNVLARATLARNTLAAIAMTKGDAGTAISHLSVSFSLACRSADIVCRVCPQPPTIATAVTASTTKLEDDPFTAQPQPTGADEPSKDSVAATAPNVNNRFIGKYLDGFQWSAAEDMINQILVLTTAQANRGTVKDAEYYLNLASEIAQTVRSPIMSARIATRLADLSGRLRKYEDSIEKLSEAANDVSKEGPEAVDIKRVRGDVFTKQDMVEEAGQMFEVASKEVQGLDAVFVAAEALMPSPRKGIRSSVTAAISTASVTETLLPEALAHVLRQQAWLLREAGYPDDCDQILAQVRQLTSSSSNKAEELYLDGRIGLHEAFSHFKTDLWMSSLTESTIAMPMGDPKQRTRDRQSTRQSIQLVLHRSEQNFLEALSLASSTGRVEDVRHACLSLALLQAFQTSLGTGSTEVTRLAAAILASSPAITFHREIIEAIESKFMDPDHDTVPWPLLQPVDDAAKATPPQKALHSSPTPNIPGKLLTSNGGDDPLDDTPLREYWSSIREKYSAAPLPLNYDISHLPPHWTVISVNVTEDRNTMFISRHQASSEPLVFTLPLDRQGRREGEAEEDLFTFEAARQQLQDIIDESNGRARDAKNVVSAGDSRAWWAKRFELDKRLQELVQSMEFCWLGAFKTILSPKCELPPAALQNFRTRLQRIFSSAISSGGEVRRQSKVLLDDTLLECFASLRPDCKDEEAEDLVYFILDIYQFYGVPVALAELDIDQIAIDVKSALTELEAARPALTISDEHLFLALDKNVSCFPWESIPILRGRAVSRIPSLSFLLDQLRLPSHPSSRLTSAVTGDGRRLIDVKKVFYILNPSEDLARTQTFFEPWLETMKASAGWKGVVGRKPTELEMVDALTNYELVLYFGHGGAEQYIRSYKIKGLSHCASVMLWGCSSGLLRDQGDLDRTGTAWNYMMAGCPSLVANLWDVTDKDIDRLSEEVFKQLNIDAAHVRASGPGKSKALLPISGQSNVQAVAKARGECKLKYLTGAAPVVYGLPVYLH